MLGCPRRWRRYRFYKNYKKYTWICHNNPRNFENAKIRAYEEFGECVLFNGEEKMSGKEAIIILWLKKNIKFWKKDR